MKSRGRNGKPHETPKEGRVTVYKIVRNTSKLIAFGALVALSLGTVAALTLHLSETAVAQQAGGVQSLRGETDIPDDSLKPVVAPQKIQEGSFARAYRQQPPLIPHTIDDVEISLTENGCLQCHEWPYNVDQDAPQISETHYVDRDGVALDVVSRNRWSCNQCHVPQSNAKELVRNDFKSALDVD
jgi:cytochrome c-type protein NapB